MTSLLATTLTVFTAFALYIAAQSAKSESSPAAYVDAGQNLPTWTYIFAGKRRLAREHRPLRLSAPAFTYGFQANPLALSLILVALATALFQKRIWLAARITGSRSLGDVFGAHFQSTSIRIYSSAVLFLFAVPFAATLLGSAGELLARASGDAISRATGDRGLAAFLFLASAIGGWRATVYIVAALSTVTVALLIFSAAFGRPVFDGLSVFHKGFSVRDGVLGDVLPGVIQFTSGIGREVPAAGLWTTTAILSFALAAVGVALSPSFGFLVAHHEKPRRLRLVAGVDHFRTVRWRASSAWSHRRGYAWSERHLVHDGDLLAAYDQLVAVCMIVMLIAMLLIAVAFFAASGASIVTVELLQRYVLLGLAPGGERLSARVALSAIYGAVVLLAAFFPAVAAVLSTLALPLSAQLFPAYLGLCWFPG